MSAQRFLLEEVLEACIEKSFGVAHLGHWLRRMKIVILAFVFLFVWPSFPHTYVSAKLNL